MKFIIYILISVFHLSAYGGNAMDVFASTIENESIEICADASQSCCSVKVEIEEPVCCSTVEHDDETSSSCGQNGCEDNSCDCSCCHHPPSLYTALVIQILENHSVSLFSNDFELMDDDCITQFAKKTYQPPKTV